MSDLARSGVVALRAWWRRDQETVLRWMFGAVLLGRLLLPFFDSPLDHLQSDPARHWNNGLAFATSSLTGGNDPYLFQLWMYLLQQAGATNDATIILGAGLLCALMPYGWYRALKELLPRPWALGGAIVVGVTPNFLGIYTFFMTETLLLTLTGFAVWLSLRAMRKRTTGAFVLACVPWVLMIFTRSVAAPMAAGVVGWIWLTQPARLRRALIAGALLVALMIPAGLHAKRSLHYFAPFGNLYLNKIYRVSGRQRIEIDFGEAGTLSFTCPSYVLPVFYPFSDWRTDRTGVVAITIDAGKGRADWIAEETRARRENTFPWWRDVYENTMNLFFGRPWPDFSFDTATGFLAGWSRWMWPPLIALAAWGAATRQFRRREWLLPSVGLGMVLFLLLQREAPLEARFRQPVDPFLLTSAIVMAYHRHRWSKAGLESSHIEG